MVSGGKNRMLNAIKYVNSKCREAIMNESGLRKYIFGIETVRFFEYFCMLGSPYFYAWIIDGATSLLTDRPIYGKLIIGILGFLLQACTMYIMFSFTQIWSLRVRNGVTREIANSILDRVTKINYNNLENSKTHEILDKVRETLSSDVSNYIVRSPFFSLICAFLSVSILSFTLARINFWIAILVLCSNSLKIGKEIVKAKKDFTVEMEQLPEKRISDSYKGILTDRTYLKEIRIYNLKYYILNKWEYIVKILKRQQNILSLKYTCIDTITDLMELGVKGIVLYLTVKMIVMGRTTIGSFLLVYEASSALADRITELSVVSKILRDIHNHIQFWHAFEEMSVDDISENNMDPGIIKDINVENISFRYFGNEKDTLNELNAYIHKGEKIAIVGANGSGKTTFVSLINGIYQPQSGKITYNNIDACDCARSINKKIITLTQNYGQYPYSVSENIAFGDIETNPSIDYIKRAAILSGANHFIEELPDKYDTILGNLTGEGSDLSIGQWQSIAIARLYVNPKVEIYILDEPTASLDANAESHIYESVLNVSKDKTLIFVSHRLSITPFMDRIIVFDNGKIVEEGSHLELIKQNGVYASMYEAQANLYRESAKV